MAARAAAKHVCAEAAALDEVNYPSHAPRDQQDRHGHGPQEQRNQLAGNQKGPFGPDCSIRPMAPEAKEGDSTGFTPVRLKAAPAIDSRALSSAARPKQSKRPSGASNAVLALAEAKNRHLKNLRRR
jgi:hypothetical protein